MARELAILGASVSRPDERNVPIKDQVGPRVTVAVQSRDLKGKPIHMVHLTDAEALQLAHGLLSAMRNVRALS